MPHSLLLFYSLSPILSTLQSFFLFLIKLSYFLYFVLLIHSFLHFFIMSYFPYFFMSWSHLSFLHVLFLLMNYALFIKSILFILTMNMTIAPLVLFPPPLNIPTTIFYFNVNFHHFIMIKIDSLLLIFFIRAFLSSNIIFRLITAAFDISFPFSVLSFYFSYTTQLLCSTTPRVSICFSNWVHIIWFTIILFYSVFIFPFHTIT